VIHKVEDVRNATQVSAAIKSAVGSHLYSFQDILSPLIAEACIQVCPKIIANFNVDNVRVAKIVGGGVADTEVVKGFVLTRGAEGMCLLLIAFPLFSCHHRHEWGDNTHSLLILFPPLLNSIIIRYHQTRHKC
jgi:chaperonin GroEL (HSP60 family)